MQYSGKGLRDKRGKKLDVLIIARAERLNKTQLQFGWLQLAKRLQLFGGVISCLHGRAAGFWIHHIL